MISAVEMQNVEKWFGFHQALRSVTMNVAKGSRVVVCGPSGSGKSTMIRCINALEDYQGGDIKVDGIRVASDSDGVERLRRKVGMVFQSFNLFAHLSVLDNITLAPRKLLRMGAKEADEWGNSLLERVKMTDFANRRPRDLSGGQQQRVAIARALAMRPEIMLLDEPTSALDPEMVKEVLDVMTELASSGMTMICVTHEMAFARAVAQEVIFMCDGCIAECCGPDRFFREPETERARQFIHQAFAR